MYVRKITVSAGCKLPHPNADFGSVASYVGLEAEIDEGENVAVCVKKLQIQADNLVEQHLHTKNEAMRQRAPRVATENKAAQLAEKHGGR